MTRYTPPAVNHDLDLVLDRVVDVPRELVFRAWTVPEHLMPWFCPKPWATTHCEIDLRPGGRFRTVMEGPGGPKMDNTGCILEVVPNERFVWTGMMGADFRPNNFGPEDPVFTCILTFTAEGKGTRYRAHLMHKDKATKEAHAKMGFSEGWGAALDQLVALLGAKR